MTRAAGLFGSAKSHGDLELNGPTPGKGGDADGRSGMPPRLSEDLEEEPARSVEGRRLHLGAGGDGGEAEHGEDAFDPVQAPQLLPEDGQPR